MRVRKPVPGSVKKIIPRIFLTGEGKTDVGKVFNHLRIKLGTISGMPSSVTIVLSDWILCTLSCCVGDIEKRRRKWISVLMNSFRIAENNYKKGFIDTFV